MKPIDEAREEIHERAEVIRSGEDPVPVQQPGETDEAFLARVAAGRKVEEQRKESA